MSSERKHRHVLDELLARSVQVPRAMDRRGVGGDGDSGRATGSWTESVEEEETPTVWAPAPRPVAVSSQAARPAGEGPGQGVEGAPASAAAPGESAGAEPRPAAESPIVRDARRPDRRGDLPAGRPARRSPGEVQVGRGPLAVHLSRAATEERLSETGERLDRTERSLKEARDRLTDTERHLDQARERLAQTEGRLAEARKHVLASEERLAMTEESERHAREEQARAEKAGQTLTTQLESLQGRMGALEEEVRAERDARIEAELGLARLRGSLVLLSPIVSGIEQATTAIGRSAAGPELPAATPGPAAIEPRASQAQAAAGEPSDSYETVSGELLGTREGLAAPRISPGAPQVPPQAAHGPRPAPADSGSPERAAAVTPLMQAASAHELGNGSRAVGAQGAGPAGGADGGLGEVRAAGGGDSWPRPGVRPFDQS